MKWHGTCFRLRSTMRQSPKVNKMEGTWAVGGRFSSRISRTTVVLEPELQKPRERSAEAWPQDADSRTDTAIPQGIKCLPTRCDFPL